MISRFLTILIRVLIRFYQRILNPMIKVATGSVFGCRYSPTCSHYFLQAVEQHGPCLGSWYGICRILRCHPWGGSGYDPIPSRRITNGEKNAGCCPHDTPHH